MYVKCPGKVLIQGGYAIIDQNNQGIVLAVNEWYYISTKII